jgi:hypothetical protein
VPCGRSSSLGRSAPGSTTADASRVCPQAGRGRALALLHAKGHPAAEAAAAATEASDAAAAASRLAGGGRGGGQRYAPY